MVDIIIFIATQILMCAVWYYLGRINAIYKMQIISTDLICVMHHNIVNWLYDKAAGLSLTEAQVESIGAFVTLSTMNRIDNVPDIIGVNKTFKQCEQRMKERLEEDEE